jgi:hypothetical protein
MTDAALIASLMIGPTYAEHVALMAGEVGETARRMAPYLSPPLNAGATPRAALH